MNDQARELYDRAQSLDREADALRFKLNSVASPAERVTLQAQIDQLSQRAADAWADWRDAQDAHRRGRSSSTGSPAATAPPPPTLSAVDVAARRRAASRALWGRIIGKVNAEMFGSQTDSAPNASREGTSSHDKAPKPDSKAIWKRVVAAANAGIAGGEPSASRESQASPDSRRQTGDFLSRAMTKASKLLKDAGYAAVR